MENWQVALIVILAIAVGVLIPAAIQFQGTMRSISRLIRDNESDIRHAVVEISKATSQLTRAGSVIESNTKELQSFFSALQDVSQGVRGLSRTLRTASILGAAVGPAVVAAVRARQAPAATATEEPATNNSDGLMLREHGPNGKKMTKET